MDLVLIKQILRLAGITNLAVRFDDPERQIIATFIKNSQARTEVIKFTDIEDLFTERPIQARSGPPLEDSTPAGP
jgi:hypothetical protein